MTIGQRAGIRGAEPALRLLFSGLVAMLLLSVGLCIDGAIVSSVADRTLSGDQLQLKRGDGEVTANGLLVRAPTARDRLVILTPPLRVPASNAGLLSWSVVGLRPEQEMKLLWTSSMAPGRALVYTPSAAERERAAADLSQQPGWSGRIGQVGLLLQGPLAEPVLVASLSLAPAQGGCSSALQAFAGAWDHREAWSQRSINFSLSKEPRVLGLSPVMIVALWVGVAALINWLLCRGCGKRARLISTAVLLLVGWLALDLRWQGQLWERLSDTHQRYSGLDLQSRKQAAPDAKLFELVEQLRAELPAEPSRILIISDDPGGYLAGRTRYHLLPHRAYAGLAELPTESQVAPGDYLFVLTTLKAADYDRDDRVLSHHGRSLPVEPIASLRGFGDLFRVRGEER